MLKLLKYEFRKSWIMLLILLSVTVALEGYFLASLYFLFEDSPWNLIISIMLLMLGLVAVSPVIQFTGIFAYAGELRRRTSYLIYMTPNSTRKIIASKFLFVFITAAVFFLLYALLGVLDVMLMTSYLMEFNDFIELMNEVLTAIGVYVDQVLIAVVLSIIYLFADLLALVGIGYTAVTLSHTWFRDKKWRWIMAVVFYIGMSQIIGFISDLFPMAYTFIKIYDAPAVQNIYNAYGMQTTLGFSDLLVYTIPPCLVSIATVILSFFGCSWMLDKKVSL